jgi:hypothetical protein
MATPPAAIQVFERTRTLTFAAHRNATIAVWRAPPTAAALDRIDGYVGKVNSRHPRIMSLIVMDGEIRPPEHDAREAHAQLTKKYESASLGVALIIDGATAKHSLFRFVLSTITLLSAPTVTQRIFGTVGSAASWAASLDSNFDRDQLIQAVSQARAVLTTP